MKYRVNEPEFVRKAEANGIVADTVDDFERSEVGFGELMGRSCRFNVLRQEEDLVAGSDVKGRKAAVVEGQVVTLVSEEGRHTGRGIRSVVVGEFGEGKEV